MADEKDKQEPKPETASKPVESTKEFLERMQRMGLTKIVSPPNGSAITIIGAHPPKPEPKPER